LAHIWRASLNQGFSLSRLSRGRDPSALEEAEVSEGSHKSECACFQANVAYKNKILAGQPAQSLPDKISLAYVTQSSSPLAAFVDFSAASAWPIVLSPLRAIRGTRTPLPDGRDSREYLAHLHTLETEAKAAKRGGWGMVQP
jgi:hypothetical protein